MTEILKNYESDYIDISSVAFEYEEVPVSETLSNNMEYYTITVEDENIVASTLVSRDRIANIEVDGDNFVEGGAIIHLYKN